MSSRFSSFRPGFASLSTLGLALVSPLCAQTSVLVPIVNATENELTTGETVTTWGYINTGTTSRFVTRGFNNMLDPEPSIVSGQPTSFLPGRHDNVWSTSRPSYNDAGEVSSVVWSLFGIPATSTFSSGTSFVRNVGGSNTYTHTAASGALPSSSLVTESGGILSLQSGTLSVSTVLNRGTGTIVLAGGVLSAGSFTNSAALNLAGGALSTPSFANTGDGVITVVSGTNTLPSFANSGQLHVEAGSLSVASLNNAGFVGITGGTLSLSSAPALGSTGTLRLDGGTLVMPTLANSGGTFDLRAGTLRLTEANLTTGAGGILGANPVLSAPVTVELQTGRTEIAAGRALTLANGATLRTQGGENDGTAYVINATLASQSGEFLNRAGRTLYAVDATLSFSGDGLRNLGTLNLVNTTVDGDVYSPAGSTINVSNTVVFNGAFHGAANFTGSDTAVFNGGYSPGDSPALVTHEGNLVFASENLLVMELAGLARGTGYDALDVGGALTFGGDLRIDFLGGYSPVGGESFDLFDFNSTLSSGFFASLLLPTLDTGLAWDTSQLYSTGVLSVAAIPEPSAAALLLAATALATATTRRRKRA